MSSLTLFPYLHLSLITVRWIWNLSIFSIIYSTKFLLLVFTVEGRSNQVRKQDFSCILNHKYLNRNQTTEMCFILFVLFSLLFCSSISRMETEFAFLSLFYFSCMNYTIFLLYLKATTSSCPYEVVISYFTNEKELAPIQQFCQQINILLFTFKVNFCWHSSIAIFI